MVILFFSEQKFVWLSGTINTQPRLIRIMTLNPIPSEGECHALYSFQTLQQFFEWSICGMLQGKMSVFIQQSLISQWQSKLSRPRSLLQHQQIVLFNVQLSWTCMRYLPLDVKQTAIDQLIVSRKFKNKYFNILIF